MQDARKFETLVAIMERLRGPDGCPWDREQSYESLRSYLIEETFEVADALDRGDREDLREELGDLLLQVVFLSQLAREEGAFTVEDVCRGINDKMIRRHPHVFGDEEAADAAEVLEHWERIKRDEKAARGGDDGSSVLDGIPKTLPALLKAHRLGTKAARVGFDWKRADDVVGKVDEELGELREAVSRGDTAAAREELGDLLFSLAMLARKLDLDPEGALEATNRKFARRFRWIEDRLRERGERLEEVGLERLEALWRAAKRAG